MYTKNSHYVFTSLLFLLSACGSGAEKKEKGTESLNVSVVRVQPVPFSQELSINADILPVEQVELMAPIQGQVMQIFFKEGQKINKGQSIVRLDDRMWKAQLPGLKAKLEVTENDLKRKSELFKIGGSSQEEVDQASAEMASLKSQIQSLEVNIDLAHIRAPFDGYLGMRNFSLGTYLKQGDQITTLTEMNSLKVNFTVPQLHQNSVKVGEKITVLIDNDTLTAEIYALNPIMNEQSRTLQVRARLKQSGANRILPGTFAEVVIHTNFSNNALLIPSQALLPSINEETVYLYKGGKAVRKVVQTGTHTSEQVHILKGISAGDTVICTGLLQIKPGMDVQILNSK